MTEAIIDLGMAVIAVIHGESHPHVAGSAIPAINVLVHGESFCSFLFDIEYVRMATGAVELGVMLFVGEGYVAVRRGGAQFQRLFQVVGERQGGVIARQGVLRLYHAVIQRPGPVDAVPEIGRRELFRESSEPVVEAFLTFHVAAVALPWRFIPDREGGFTVMARPAILAAEIGGPGDSGVVPAMAELELEVADPAGVPGAVRPVGKDNRRHAGFLAFLAEDHIAVMFGRAIGGDRLDDFPQFVTFYPPGRSIQNGEYADHEDSY